MVAGNKVASQNTLTPFRDLNKEEPIRTKSGLCDGCSDVLKMADIVFQQSTDII
jgi:hypothetical protein